MASGIWLLTVTYAPCGQRSTAVEARTERSTDDAHASHEVIVRDTGTRGTNVADFHCCLSTQATLRMSSDWGTLDGLARLANPR